METPQELGLPEKFDHWRDGQDEVIQAVTSAREKVFLLDAPTGVGKSVIGIASYKKMFEAWRVMGRLVGEEEEKNERCIYLTKTKQLQDQIMRDFPEAKTIKGRANYPCLLHENKFPDITSEHCLGSQKCPKKPVCPYWVDKEAAIAAPIAVLNEAYFLAEANGPGDFSGTQYLIVDEVDGMESSLLNHIRFSVSLKQMQRFGLEPPKDYNNPKAWPSWAEDSFYRIQTYTNTYGQQLGLGGMAVEETKLLKRLNNFGHKLAQFTNLVSDSWTFEQMEVKGDTRWEFKPTRVAPYANLFLWQHSERVLGMSGTILDPGLLANDLGIRHWQYKAIPSPFPVENRPIFYKTRPWYGQDDGPATTVDLSYARREAELPKLAAEIKEIVAHYPNDKCLVHTVSYPNRDFLMAAIGSDRVITHDSDDREEKLEYFKRTSKPLVMLSPSFDRGVDLPEDQCRCNIVGKVPYPNMSDKQVKERMDQPDGRRWYLVTAARSMMQMTGRVVRGPGDWGHTFIMDRQFNRLKGQLANIISKWWLEAVK